MLRADLQWISIHSRRNRNMSSPLQPGPQGLGPQRRDTLDIAEAGICSGKMAELITLHVPLQRREREREGGGGGGVETQTQWL